MNPVVVKRIKRAWAIALVGVTGVALVGWGFQTAVVAALTFAGVSVQIFVAYFLYVLLGDIPVPVRILLILFFFAGLLVEIGAIIHVLGGFAM